MNVIDQSNFPVSDARTYGPSAVSRNAWTFVTFAVAYGALLAGGGKLLNDPDTLWHIAAGRWIFAQHRIPETDPFSHSLFGMPWVAHEWLSECLSAALYDSFGWTGMVMGAAFAGAATFAIFADVILKYLPPKLALPVTALSFLLAASHMTARPHLFAMPLLALWAAKLAAARAERRAPAYWLVPTMTLWANMHGGFIVGLGLCCALAAEAVLAAPHGSRVTAIRSWGIFTAGTLAASLVTPYGFTGWLFPFHLLSLGFSLGFVNEWHAPDFSRFEPIELWIAGFVIAIAVYRPKLSAIRVLLISAIVYLALAHVRNAELLALIVPPLLAEPLAKAMLRPPVSIAARTGFTVVALSMAAVAIMGTAAGFIGYRHDDSAIMPAQALSIARAEGLNGPVFNYYDFGGYLIFSGVPVFVDGRVDLYGDDFMRQYARAVAGDSETLPRVLDQYRIEWTLLPPRAPAVAAMDRMPGWQRVYADNSAVVHRRVPRAFIQAPSPRPHQE